MKSKKLSNHLTKIILLLLLTTIVNCNSDSDAFASFEDGRVTRKEVRDFYEIRGLKIDPESASIQKQASLVEQIAYQKIVFEDSIKSGKVTKEFLENLVHLTKGQILLSLYKKSFEEKAVKQTPMELIDMQMLVLRDPENSLAEKGQELLTKLNSSSSSEIDKIISENTQDDSRKSINGLIEPYCLNCGPNPFEDILSELLKEKYGKFYLKKSNDIIYIVRILGKRNISEPSVGRYLTKVFKNFESTAKEYEAKSQVEADKQNAKYYSDSDPEDRGKSMGEHLARQFKANIWQKELKRIKSESKIQVQNPPILKSPEDLKMEDFPVDRVLANLSNSEAITVGSFQKDFKGLSEVLGKGNAGNAKQEMWDLLNFFYNVYISSLYLQEDNQSKKLLKTDLYDDSLEYLKYSLVWALFMKDISAEKVMVSDSEIRETYEAGKMFAYSSPDPKNPQKRNPISFSEVRLKILSDLENAKRKSIFDKKINELKVKSKLTVNQEILRNGKI
jgi:hypothetical protein